MMELIKTITLLCSIWVDSGHMTCKREFLRCTVMKEISDDIAIRECMKEFGEDYKPKEKSK